MSRDILYILKKESSLLEGRGGYMIVHIGPENCGIGRRH